MNLSERRTFLPQRVVTKRGHSTAYLDYVAATYLTALDDLEISVTWRIEGQFVACPELVSYKFYQKVDYWWILCRINGIVCPTTEFVEGRELKIPTITSIEKALTKAITVDAVGTTVEL